MYIGRRIAGKLGRTMNRRHVLVGLLFFLAGLAAPSLAAVPQRLNYQGKLGDASGDPLTGTYNLRFRFCSDENCSGVLYSETWDDARAVSVANGVYSVQIGSYTPIPGAVFDGSVVYLE